VERLLLLANFLDTYERAVKGEPTKAFANMRKLHWFYPRIEGGSGGRNGTFLKEAARLNVSGYCSLPRRQSSKNIDHMMSDFVKFLHFLNQNNIKI
jgi:hypothetical protein